MHMGKGDTHNFIAQEEKKFSLDFSLFIAEKILNRLLSAKLVNFLYHLD